MDPAPLFEPKSFERARRPGVVWVYVAMGLVLLVVAGIRLRLLEFPLERDEGEYAYMGRLILDGGVPYVDAANMKWPGTYFAYAAVMTVFGQTTAGIHAGLLLVTLASALLLFVLGRRICGPLGGAVAAGVHAVLAVGVPTLGLAAHATHFVVLCALGGLVVVTGRSRVGAGRAFAAGLLFGLAGLMKQSGAAFGVLAMAWLFSCELTVFRQTRDWCGGLLRLGALGAGGLAPLALVALWIWRVEAWPAFWAWTVVYAQSYTTLVSRSQGVELFSAAVRGLLHAAPVLWGAAAAGFVGVSFWAALRGWRFFLFGLGLLSLAGVCPGWFFRGHYFLLLLPAVALFAGVAVAGLSIWLETRCPRWPLALLPVLVISAGAAHALWVGRAVFFQLTPMQACRAVYGVNPFPESMEIARYLREHTAPEARIAILGSEPQILFYANRRSATPFLYAYPLVEPQPFAEAMQRDFILQVEAADPDYLVFVGIEYSWLRWPASRTDIFQWFAGYQRRFHLVGLADIEPEGLADVRWFDQPSTTAPRSPNWILVLRNNRLAPR